MNNYSGKRLLLLGGGGQCLKVVSAAKELGVYVIVADLKANRLVIDEADEYFQCSLLDSDRLLNWCRENRIDGVLNFCVDFAQKTEYELCSSLGLPCCYEKKQLDILTDKRLFKKTLRCYGLDTIPEYTESDVLEEKVEYPILIKPAESSGSRGSTVCNSFLDAESAIIEAKKVSRNGEIIVEKYMGTANDFCVTYFVINGEPYLIRTGDRYLGSVEDGLERQCICGVYPSKHTDFYVRTIDEKVKAMIRGIGLKNGPVFMQGFVDGDTVRWYDPGIRFSGGEYELYYKRITGINLMQAMINFAFTGKMSVNKNIAEESFRLNGYCAIQLLIDCCPGVIDKLDGLNEIKNMQEVSVVTQKNFAGDEIKKTGDIKQRICEIDLVLENDKMKICGAIEKVQNLLVVEDRLGNNMLVSQINVNDLE